MSESWLEVVAPIVRRAGGMIRRDVAEGKSKNAQRKARGEWVTPMDRRVEDFIVEGLQKYFPKDGFLGEESGLQGNADSCWVIDPVDGTTNFVHNNPMCAVSVAYCGDGAAQLAVVYDVFRDELYTAARARGAFVDDRRLRVSGQLATGDALLMVSGQMGMKDGALWRLVAQLAHGTDGARRSGSTVLDLAWLAAGRVDVVVCGPVNFWDVAAAALLVREAGGLITDVRGEAQFAFNQPTACFVAATPKIFGRFFTETKNFCQAHQLL